MEILGEKIEERGVRYGCNIKCENRTFIGRVTSDKREFEIENGQHVIYVSKYICSSILQKIFSFGFYNVFKKEGATVFQLHKCGPLKISTKLKMPDEFEFKIPTNNSFSISCYSLNISVDGTKFKTAFDKEKHFDLAICLSYFCWLRQQIWDNSVYQRLAFEGGEKGVIHERACQEKKHPSIAKMK